MKGKNLAFDKAPRSFSFEQAFLSSRDYKRIFCISVIVVVLRCAIFIPILAEWKLTEWEASTLAVLVLVLELILGGLFIFIPVMLVLRTLLGYLLKKISRDWKK